MRGASKNVAPAAAAAERVRKRRRERERVMGGAPGKWVVRLFYGMSAHGVSGLLCQRADLDVLPAALGAGGPVLAAVDLDGDASFGTEGFEDRFLVVALGRGRRAVPDTDLLVVDPGGDFGVFSLHQDAGRRSEE